MNEPIALACSVKQEGAKEVLMRHLVLLPTLMLTLGIPLMAHEGWNHDRHEEWRDRDHRREVCRPCPPPKPVWDRCERPVHIDAWRWQERGRVHYEAVRPVIVTPAPIVVAPPAPILHVRPRIQVWFGF